MDAGGARREGFGVLYEVVLEGAQRGQLLIAVVAAVIRKTLGRAEEAVHLDELALLDALDDPVQPVRVALGMPDAAFAFDYKNHDAVGSFRSGPG